MALNSRKASLMSGSALPDQPNAQTVHSALADYGPQLLHHSPMLLTPEEAASSGHKLVRRCHSDVVYLLRREQQQITAMEEARADQLDKDGKEWSHWASGAIYMALHLFSDPNAQLRAAAVTKQVLPLLRRHLPGLSDDLHGLHLLGYLRQLGMALLFEDAAIKAGPRQKAAAAAYTGTIRAMLAQALAAHGSDDEVHVACLVRMGLSCAPGPVLLPEPTLH